jgi:hypothetical protein
MIDPELKKYLEEILKELERISGKLDLIYPK